MDILNTKQLMTKSQKNVILNKVSLCLCYSSNGEKKTKEICITLPYLFIDSESVLCMLGERFSNIMGFECFDTLCKLPVKEFYYFKPHGNSNTVYMYAICGNQSCKDYCDLDLFLTLTIWKDTKLTPFNNDDNLFVLSSIQKTHDVNNELLLYIPHLEIQYEEKTIMTHLFCRKNRKLYYDIFPEYPSNLILLNGDLSNIFMIKLVQQRNSECVNSRCKSTGTALPFGFFSVSLQVYIFACCYSEDCLEYCKKKMQFCEKSHSKNLYNIAC